jgi:NAD(P)-dependent dehydrogenase (short-subunit alcohol dehydrogenase family)
VTPKEPEGPPAADAPRSALVTGAGTGIGRAIALRLARDGWAVAVNDVDAGRAAAVAAEVDAAGGRVAAVVGAVGERAATRAVVDRAVEALGALDLLVNNAGICRLGAVADFAEADWHATFRVNVDAVFFACQAVLPRMLARGRGDIVNVASWSGKAGAPYFGPYCASKFAVIGLTQSLAKEVAPHGLRVNAVCPGIVAGTEMRAQVDEASRRLGRPTSTDRLGWIPMGRLATPEDVAGVVAFLVSPEAAYMTGQAINVTGGLWMH